MTDRAILFLQLGGPENLDEVPGFLYRLFSDPDVIRVRPAILRKAIAAAIAITRKNTSRKLYASIGGGSPIRRLTEEQAAGVERLLRQRGRDAIARAAMNCSSPLVEDVVRQLAGAGMRRFLALPLYPHYSLTTTKGALERSREAVRLLFSAHSIPRRLVTRQGDPYQREIEASVRAIHEKAGGRSPWTLAYQSRFGPVEWLGPATLDVIGELGRKGEKQVLAVPIAFVTDHVETLYEIDQLFGRAAEKAGIAHFRRTPGLNDRPTFLRALEDIILSQREFWSQ